MDFTSKKIAIWGLGIVGKAAVRFFHKQNIAVDIMEKRELSSEEQRFLIDHKATFSKQTDVPTFLAAHDMCLASPGIDLRPYSAYHDRFVTELDIFQQFWTKPIIAITGSVGKTTTTYLLSQLLSKSMRIATGGNIGIGMLDLLLEQNNYDCALLELSSFQLEANSSFAPTLALWTNFYANHLDRHMSAEEYFKAKAQIFLKQAGYAHAIVPLAEQKKIRSLAPERPFIWCSTTPPADDQVEPCDSVYYLENNHIMCKKEAVKRIICSVDLLPKLSFVENWLFIVAALDTLNIPVVPLLHKQSELHVPEHRLEKVAVINGATFYNDSKSTIPMATMAALNNFEGKPIVLFIGGISKGVDRSPFVTLLAGKVKMLYCFGKEARQLCDIARSVGINSFVHETLEDAVKHCMKQIENGDIVLFSPAGASYDLFKNYEERGTRFKALIKVHLKS